MLHRDDCHLSPSTPLRRPSQGAHPGPRKTAQGSRERQAASEQPQSASYLMLRKRSRTSSGMVQEALPSSVSIDESASSYALRSVASSSSVLAACSAARFIA